jgi:hypothetical protein
MANDKRRKPIPLSHFVEMFPEVPLPVTLNDEAIHTFSQNNEVLSAQMVEQFLEPLTGESTDEFTEFVPCFRIPETFEMTALVFWKAGLMNYQYVLATYDNKSGALIDIRVLGGTFSDGRVITRSIATIDDDWIIYVVSGQTEGSEDETYDAKRSRAVEFELLADGKIIEGMPSDPIANDE